MTANVVSLSILDHLEDHFKVKTAKLLRLPMMTRPDLLNTILNEKSTNPITEECQVDSTEWAASSRNEPIESIDSRNPRAGHHHWNETRKSRLALVTAATEMKYLR